LLPENRVNLSQDWENQGKNEGEKLRKNSSGKRGGKFTQKSFNDGLRTSSRH
jgi:hypothetical protein